MNRKLLNEHQRIDLPAKLFGIHFPLRVEPFIYDMAGLLSNDYRGGYWHMYEIENGGFQMSPNGETYQVSCMNGFEGALSGDALGIVVCMYAYSELSFTGIPGFAESCGRQYHLLRDCMFEHGEVEAILGTID